MVHHTSARIRLAVLIASAGALSLGLLWRDGRYVVGAAIIHIVVGVAQLVQMYREAKLLRAGTWKPHQRSLCGQLGNWINWVITLTGLVLVCANQVGATQGYGIAGWIIWGGAILCYFLSGIIAREVGGIPLSMGYGGWTVRRARNGRYRM